MNKSAFFHIDWGLVLPVVILVIFSLTTLISINTDFFRNQLIYFILGAVLCIFFSHIQYQVLRTYSLPIYVVSLILLLFLVLAGFEGRRGAVRWITIFGVAIQFSELLKPFLILCLAHMLTSTPGTSFKKWLLVLFLLLPITVAIYRQPDLGNAIIYTLTTVGMLLFYGFPLWWFASGLGGFLVLIPFSWRFLHTYQQQRILTFLHLVNDTQGISYNVNQSIIAVGSGGWFGKGLGQGTQSALRFLPERQTDFLFATFSEMFGFFGAVLLIALFVFLFYRLYKLIQTTDDDFAKVFIAGACILLFIQCFVNIGMNIGILPIVGVTLPFMSYGGSSFISNAILLGLVVAMSKKHSMKHVLEIK